MSMTAKQLLVKIERNNISFSLSIDGGGNAKPLKYVVARYAVGTGVSSTLLLSEIPKIISGLYSFRIIVNNVTADGASENRSAFRALATITMKEIFDKNTSLHLTTKQKSRIPLSEYNVAFYHPIQDVITVFIGGEMAVVQRYHTFSDNKYWHCYYLSQGR